MLLGGREVFFVAITSTWVKFECEKILKSFCEVRTSDFSTR